MLYIWKKKNNASISVVDNYNSYRLWIIMVKKNLLLVPGDNKIFIINTEQYKLVRTIEAPNSNLIQGVCLLNKDMLLTGDTGKTIRQWKIEGDNLILMSKKENAHENDINVLLNLGNGFIASGSDDGTIKIWWIW